MSPTTQTHTAQLTFAHELDMLHGLCKIIARTPNPAGDAVTVPVTATNGFITNVPVDMAVMDSDASWHALNQTLANMQLNEYVSRDRGPRFWTGPLPEHRVLPDGHDVTRGSLLLIDWPSRPLMPQTIALVRVSHILLGASAAKSCKLDKKPASNQQFRVEICVRLPESQARGKAGGACFVATGRSYPGTLRSSLVKHVVALEGCPHEIVANMDQDEVSVYTCAGTVFLELSALAAEPAGPELIDDPENSETFEEVCCRCSIGWWDDTTGSLEQCQGGCMRCFHRTCLDEQENDALDKSADWQCNKCSGRDTEICDACENEWFCDDQESSFYTGSMLQSDACTRWWHQTCHEPRITNADAKKKKWRCASWRVEGKSFL